MCCSAQRPRQFSWLGYWATTGLAEVLDGVLVDPLLVPPGSPEACSFVEPLLRLPQGRWCYRPVPWMPDPVDPPCLARGWLTFGSFNSATKLNIQVLQCSAAVLKAVPGSRLVSELPAAGCRPAPAALPAVCCAWCRSRAPGASAPLFPCRSPGGLRPGGYRPGSLSLQWWAHFL